GIYQPDAADGPALATVVTEFGFASFTPDGPGSYWVAEVAAPVGYELSDPLLVPFLDENAQQNCVIARPVALTCRPDEDQTGGLVLAFFANSPTGGVSPTSAATPPATDTAMSTGRTDDRTAWVVVGGLLVAAGVLILPSARHRPVGRRGSGPGSGGRAA
ncbi:MAG TPA: SpaA isopeptide-forming pilin-related protein, partial [Candidatus Limnocylindrales bacterium]